MPAVLLGLVKKWSEMKKPVKLDRSAAIEKAQSAVGLVVCLE
jgi:hypothetical protein